MLSEHKRAVNIVCYYTSRHLDDGEEENVSYGKLGFTGRTETHRSIAKRFYVKASYVKNMEDAYDSIHKENNHRKGWHQRELRPNQQEIVNEFKDHSEEELFAFAYSLLHAHDKMASWFDSNFLTTTNNAPRQGEPTADTELETPTSSKPTESLAERDKPKAQKYSEIPPDVFSLRIQNVLKREGIYSVEDLLEVSRDDIIAYRNLGVKGAKEIETFLEQAGGYTERISLDQRLDVLREHRDNHPVTFLQEFFEERLAKSLVTGGIECVEELAIRTQTEIIEIKRLGRKSTEKILQTLEQLGVQLLARPMVEDLAIVHSNIKAIKSAREASMKRPIMERVAELLFQNNHDATDRNLLIFQRWYGLYENPAELTLEAVGEEFGVTRERVRQLRNRINEQLTDIGFFQQIEDALRNELEDRTHPLLVDNIQRHLPTFSGLEGKKVFWGRIAKETNVPISLVESKSGVAITLGSLTAIEDAQRDICTALISLSLGQPADRARISRLSKMYAQKHEIPEFTAELERTTHDSLLTIPSIRLSDNDESTLSVIGLHSDTVKKVFENLMAISEKSINVYEITKDLKDSGYSTSSDNFIGEASARAELMRSAYTFDSRSTYGLAKHTQIPESSWQAICKETAAMMQAEPERQWHTNNIVERLIKKGLDIPDNTTAYELSAVLRENADLHFLGRNKFMLEKGEKRINLQQFSKLILLEAGKPMKLDEVREKIEERMGVGRHWSEQSLHPDIISLGDKTVGLKDRDILRLKELGLSHDAILETLHSELGRRPNPIHRDELSHLLGISKEYDKGDPVNQEIYAIALIDKERFRGFRGFFVGLADWEESGRMTIQEATIRIIDNWSGPMKPKELVDRYTQLLGRPWEPREERGSRNGFKNMFVRSGFSKPYITYYTREDHWDIVT